MTSTEIAKYTTKAEAKRMVNILREYIIPNKKAVGKQKINDYDIFEAKDKLNELVRSDCTDDNWEKYNRYYDLVVVMIERGEK